jgi:hypothetical protein
LQLLDLLLLLLLQIPGWDAALLASAAVTQDLSPGDIMGYYLAIRHLPLLLLTGEDPSWLAAQLLIIG